MALSNIFREPRREITETLVGVVLVGGFAFIDFKFAKFGCGAESCKVGCITFGMVIGVIAAIVAGLLLGLMHWVGEEICNSLAKVGLELRPKARPQKEDATARDIDYLAARGLAWDGDRYVRKGRTS